jgi:Domain of unknown function (DUF4259)
MGTWAVDAFGNDGAADWAYEVEGAEDLSIVESALDAILADDADYVEATDAEVALAAIEVIARLQGNWREKNPYSENVDRWVEKHPIQPPAALVKKAHLVIDRILAENSELNEVWSESDEHASWLASVAELRSRVQG